MVRSTAQVPEQGGQLFPVREMLQSTPHWVCRQATNMTHMLTSTFRYELCRQSLQSSSANLSLPAPHCLPWQYLVCCKLCIAFNAAQSICNCLPHAACCDCRATATRACATSWSCWPATRRRLDRTMCTACSRAWQYTRASEFRRLGLGCWEGEGVERVASTIRGMWVVNVAAVMLCKPKPCCTFAS